jgi:hypothetical protein
MGRAKEWMMEMQEQEYQDERAEWIRRELNDDEADESSEGWYDLEAQYDEIHENWINNAEEEYAWYHEQEYSFAYISFLQSTADITKILNSHISPDVSTTVYKMLYVHAVTILESYLGDTLKTLVLKNSVYVSNAAKNLHEIKERKLKPYDVLSDKEIVEKLVSAQLSEYLYHDVVKTLELYKVCLDFKYSYDLGEVIKATKLRHDLVHRNGKDKNGKHISLSVQDLKSSLHEIENLVKYLDKELSPYRKE